MYFYFNFNQRFKLSISHANLNECVFTEFFAVYSDFFIKKCHLWQSVMPFESITGKATYAVLVRVAHQNEFIKQGVIHLYDCFC
jgi:hypothetical protein